MKQKKNSFARSFIEYLWEAAELLPQPYETPSAWVRRRQGFSKRNYYYTVFNLKKSGIIRVYKKDNRKFVQLTKKGQMQVLLNSFSIVRPNTWDGKWRIVIFDIPEESKAKRNLLRWLLKKNDFIMLQASVYITPYPLSKKAIVYLKESKLIDFIRIAKVEEMDDDRDLKKKFHLKAK